MASTDDAIGPEGVKVTTDGPTLMDDKTLASCVKSFAAMDVNGDGILTLDEFRSGLGMLGMDPEFATILFNSFDRNSDGRINQREFCASMAVMMHPTDMVQQVTLAFDAYDTNKDGKLDLSEMTRVITAIFSTMEKMGIRDERSDPEDTANDLFSVMDAEGKGFVTKADYIEVARTQPELFKKMGIGLPQATRMPTNRSASKKKNERTASSGARRGTTVGFGHANWELVVQMMLAIRHSVARAKQMSRLQLGLSSDEVEAKRTTLERETSVGGHGHSLADGAHSLVPDVRLRPSMYTDSWSTRIPGHRGGKEVWTGFKDYAPLVFRRIRSLFGVGDRDYMCSLGPEQVWRPPPRESRPVGRPSPPLPSPRARALTPPPPPPVPSRAPQILGQLLPGLRSLSLVLCSARLLVACLLVA